MSPVLLMVQVAGALVSLGSDIEGSGGSFAGYSTLVTEEHVVEASLAEA